MRRLPVLCAFILLCPTALAQYYGPASEHPYSVERWDEDYSYLKDPGQRTDFFDPIKYIPLNADGDWYLSLGGQARYRFDYFNNTSFGAGVQDENGFHLTRLLAHLDAHFGPNLRAFVQLNSGMADNRAGGLRPGDADEFDLQQAFADLRLPLSESGDTSVTARLGRQELIYGSQRLVSPSDWNNVRRTFEGARLTFAFPNDTLDLFLTRPVVIEKEEPNTGDNHTSFAGVYNVTALPDLIRDADSRLELYFLALNKSPSAITGFATTSDTYTLGSRFKTSPTPWDFDIELDYQLGETAGESISAYSLATELGYTFSNVPFTPRAYAGLDVASGSHDPGRRFNQLFPPQYTYLGHIYLFGRQNIIDAHAGASLALTSAVTLQLDQHVFWRQNVNDAAYGITGAVARPDNGSDAAYLGTEFDSVINWQITRHFSAYLGYAHFFTGTFISQTGPSHDIDFLYAAATFTF
jgi:hypothetical protein